MAGKAAGRVVKGIDIVELMSQSIPVARHGRTYRGLCWFCDGEEETVVIHRAEGFFHCGDCNREGDVIDWLMLTGKMSRRDAVRSLLSGRASRWANPR